MPTEDNMTFDKYISGKNSDCNQTQCKLFRPNHNDSLPK